MTASWAPNMVIFMGTVIIIVYLTTVVWEFLLSKIPDDELEIEKSSLKMGNKIRRQELKKSV